MVTYTRKKDPPFPTGTVGCHSEGRGIEWMDAERRETLILQRSMSVGRQSIPRMEVRYRFPIADGWMIPGSTYPPVNAWRPIIVQLSGTEMRTRSTCRKVQLRRRGDPQDGREVREVLDDVTRWCMRLLDAGIQWLVLHAGTRAKRRGHTLDA